MMQRFLPKFTGKYNPIALGVLLACSFAQPVFANEPVEEDKDKEEKDLETIQVRGIRSSIKQSMAVKRDAIVIADVISAEDLGKFPDQNVAESLQRITGVSIDRSTGEGQYVSVRGFGPEFNSVLVNGRQLATENEGREFSFDVLSAELIRSADVFKTPDATLQDGGIGATINVKTARPFDFDGLRASASAKTLYNDLNGNNSPFISGLVSNTFYQGTVGALVSFAHSDNDTQTNMVDTRGYRPGVDFTTAAGDSFTDAFVPQNYDQIVDLQGRKRTTMTSAFQYSESDDWLVTFDTLYSRFQVNSDAHALGHWFTDSQFNDAAVDDNGTVVFIDHNDNGATDFIRRSFGRDVELQAYGLNFVLDLNQNLTMNVDVSTSTAEDNSGGNINFNVIGFNNSYQFDNRQGGLPNISFAGQADGFDKSLAKAHYVERNGWNRKDELSEFKAILDWSPDSMGTFSKLTTTFYYQDRTKNNQRLFSAAGSNCLYCGYATDVPDALLSPFNASNFFGGVPNQWMTYNPQAYFAYLESPEANALNPNPDAAKIIADNNGFTPAVQPDRFEVQEKIFSFNVNFLFEGELAAKPWAINAGFRYSQTDATLAGEQQTLVDLVEIPEDETMLQAVFAGEGSAISADNDYAEFLPDINARINLDDDLILRGAFSKTLTRPTMSALAPRTNIDVTRPNNLQASGGNANLSPFVSTNYDLSLEWYYGDSSYLTGAVFRKEVDNFITSIVEQETFNLDSGDYTFDVRRPRNGQEATVDGLEIAWTQTLDYGFGFLVNATFVDSDAELDLNNISETFALEGLGDSQNIVLFYERDEAQMRIAYNNRDSFMKTLSNATGGDPIFVDAYGQWDVSGSYDIDDVWTVFFEGINITGEEVVSFGRFANQILRVEDTGARWAIGFRGQF